MVTFQENVGLLHNRQKMYTKLSTLAVFSIGPLLHSKHEVTQKGGRDGKSEKGVTRLNTFLEVFTKVKNTKNLLFPVLLLSTGLKRL